MSKVGQGQHYTERALLGFVKTKMNVRHFGAHGNISVLSLMPKSFTKQPSKTPLAVDDSYKHDLVLGTCILPRARPVSSTQPLTVDGLDHNSTVLPIKKLRMTSAHIVV